MTSVRDFGAAGDGTTDDTDSLQHAIDESPGQILLPPGSYRITRTLQVALDRQGPLAISGTGGTARILNEANGPALRIAGTHAGSADPNSFQPGVWTTERMPNLSDFEIVGTHDEAEGVQLLGTMQATLTRLLIRRCKRAIHLVERNRNLLVSDCHIYQGRPHAIGIHFEGVNLHQAIIIGSHISYQPHAGIKIERSEVRNLQITGCDIEYNHDPENRDSADVWIDAREGTIREGTIASNTIQAKLSPNGSNVRIEGPDDPGFSRGAGLWTITGNILQSQAVNLRLTSCRGVVVTGNSFASGYERSLVISKCRHINVGTNTFDYNPDYEGDRIDGITILDSAGINLHGLTLEATGSNAAITIERSSEVLITGCQILDPEQTGIFIADSRRCTISGNMILDRQSRPNLPSSIQVAGETTAVSILDNTLSRSREAADASLPPESIRGNIAIP